MAKPRPKRNIKLQEGTADSIEGGPFFVEEEDLGIPYVGETLTEAEYQGLLYCKKHSRIELADAFSREAHRPYIPPQGTSPLVQTAINLFVIEAENIDGDHRRHALVHSTARSLNWKFGPPKIPYRNDCRECIGSLFIPEGTNGNSE